MIPISIIILVSSVWLGSLSIRVLILPVVLLILLVRILILLLLPVALLVILLRTIVAISILIAVIGFLIVVRLLRLLLGHPLRLSISLHCPCPRIISVVILMLPLRRSLLVLLAIAIVRHLSPRRGRPRARSSLPRCMSSLASRKSVVLEAAGSGQRSVADLLPERFERVTRSFDNRYHRPKQVFRIADRGNDCMSECGETTDSFVRQDSSEGIEKRLTAFGDEGEDKKSRSHWFNNQDEMPFRDAAR